MEKEQQLEVLKKHADDKETSFRGELSLASVVAQDALDAGDIEEAIGYLKDVCTHGCVSGTCSGLIYYIDTHAFYNEHADEIDGILEELEQNTGEGFKFEGKDVRNTLAWIGYEETARKLLDEMEEEI